MVRKCASVPIDDLLQELGFSGDRFKLYVDRDVQEEIMDFLAKESVRKKFRVIIRQIATGQYNPDLYDREDVSPKAKNITAMKFKGRSNFRLYCKEFRKRGRQVVMIQLLHKKTQRVNKQLQSRIEALGGYTYEFPS